MWDSEEWEKFKSRKFHYGCDCSKAMQLINLLPAQFRINYSFWSWVWILSIPACLTLAFFHWWLALSVFVVPTMIFRSVKQSAGQFVLDYAEQNKEFFEYCLTNKIITR